MKLILSLKPQNKYSKFALFLLGISSTFFSLIPVQAAEKIFLTYGPLKLSVEVKSLEIFVQDDTVNDDLAQYLNLVTPDKREQFREILTKKIELDPLLVSRFFNTEIGQSILMRLGKGITIEGGVNGGYALRGAIVQAALDPSGLTLLNVLKKYPTNLQIQGELLLGAIEHIDKTIAATENLIKEMPTWTAQEASNNTPVDYANLPDIRKAGQYQVKKEVWQLTDTSRNRKFYVDVYVPQGVLGSQIPVIILSHGLASRPEDFAEGINYIASYGYVVAAPQHVGSDTIYLKEMFEGYHKNIFDRDEFINRPKDISFVIDELERRNASQFQGKLNLKNVGVAGHSFGGYTSLALAGATIDFDYLQKGCDRLYGALDVAILLQCRALELPRQDYQLRDPRVSAVFVANPVNRYIFAETGINKINIPVLFISGSSDPAAPPVFEQALPFSWLTTPAKYWVLIEGQAHVNFNKLDGGIKEALDTVVNLSVPSQDVITSYTKPLSLSFFEVHLRHNEAFRPYLQSSYALYLSENQEFKLDFISSASLDKVKEAIVKNKID